jgi:hypothetical protein
MPGTERTPNAEALAWRHEVDAQELADPTGSRFNAPSGQQMAQAGPQTATDAGPQGDLAAAEQAELAKIPMPKAGNTDLGTMYRTIRERAPNATAPQIQQYIHNMVAQRGPEVTRQFEIEMKQHEEQVATVREKYRQLREQQKEDRTGQGVITGPDDNQYVRHGDVAHPLTVQGTGEQIGKSEKLSKPTLLEYTGEDGKVERVEAQHIESGPKKGQWVTADQLRAPIDVSKGKWSIISGGAANALGGARDAAQRERQIIAGREIQSDLENIVKLPVATTRGIFGSRTPGPGLFDALKEDLAETMTSEDAELAQSALAGLERELSIITSPVYGGKWAAESFAPLKLKEGQTVFVKLYNIARMRQTADNALEAMTKSPRIGEDQKKYAAEMRTMLDKAIPWLPNDVMAFRDQAKREGRERPEDKGESFGEFVAKHGIGGAAKRGAEGEAGTAGAQEDVAHDPKTGQEYVKRNGQWVPR